MPGRQRTGPVIEPTQDWCELYDDPEWTVADVEMERRQQVSRRPRASALSGVVSCLVPSQPLCPGPQGRRFALRGSGGIL